MVAIFASQFLKTKIRQLIRLVALAEWSNHRWSIMSLWRI